MSASSLISAHSLGEFAEAASALPPITHQAARESAQLAVADTIACIIAAVDDPATSIVRETAVNTGMGRCSAIATSAPLSTEAAAMLNGTAAHALDFDDNYLPAVTHASAVLVPTLLALGEECQVAGTDLIDAYIVGLEIQAWLGAQMSPDHYVAGWHATSTIGTIGAAAAAARLLRLPDGQFRNSISIACSLAGGSKVQMGTMTKPLHAGLAARSGVLASKLALAGMEANSEPMSGEWGFVAMHHGRRETARTNRTDFSVVTDGLAQKRFPCCASAHRSLDAIVQLRSEHGFGPEDIEAIETTIPSSNFRNLRFNQPRNEKEARFSMTYCAALAAIQGHLSLSDFEPDAVNRAPVRELMSKVTMKDAGPESDEGTGIWDFPAHTRIRLRDGSDFELSIEQPVGTKFSPLSLKDNERKFEDCVGQKLSGESKEHLKSVIKNIENRQLNELTGLLRKASASELESV
ncbi:MmgE/PrpD family protein [Roseibium denhamense]|uniref:2-methylcitrate dehydratase PrpD n=1 Tax=Roseibium denhamense TaxID=76305 RepID=A0ABY1NCP9_9HYPH|nr:MmgE/PrpD family protein [Roseibium denhamense]SMP06560.1 2-methylcitrate dehydratase PrpD [Roseibium denhamense]